MAKKTSNSRKSASASASAENPTNGKVVLKIKSTGKMKKVTKQSRPNSGKKPKTTPKKKPAKVDAKKPKKPPTAFFYFLFAFFELPMNPQRVVEDIRFLNEKEGLYDMLEDVLDSFVELLKALYLLVAGEDFRKEFQEKNPDVKSMRDIGKACGEKWKTMTYEEKVQYYDIATEKRAEFDRATAEYNKMKESGEDQESENSEFDE